MGPYPMAPGRNPGHGSEGGKKQEPPSPKGPPILASASATVLPRPLPTPCAAPVSRPYHQQSSPPMRPQHTGPRRPVPRHNAIPRPMNTRPWPRLPPANPNGIPRVAMPRARDPHCRALHKWGEEGDAVDSVGHAAQGRWSWMGGFMSHRHTALPTPHHAFDEAMASSATRRGRGHTAHGSAGDSRPHQKKNQFCPENGQKLPILGQKTVFLGLGWSVEGPPTLF